MSGVLRIPIGIQRQIMEQALAGLPEEVCGLLAGNGDVVSRAFPLRNASARTDFFTIDPYEQLRALREMRDSELQLLAIYHSHPETPARPSAEDIANANDPDVAYVIVSLVVDAPDVRAFTIRDGVSTPLPIETLED